MIEDLRFELPQFILTLHDSRTLQLYHLDIDLLRISQIATQHQYSADFMIFDLDKFGDKLIPLGSIDGEPHHLCVAVVIMITSHVLLVLQCIPQQSTGFVFNELLGIVKFDVDAINA